MDLDFFCVFFSRLSSSRPHLADVPPFVASPLRLCHQQCNERVCWFSHACCWLGFQLCQNAHLCCFFLTVMLVVLELLGMMMVSRSKAAGMRWRRRSFGPRRRAAPHPCLQNFGCTISLSQSVHGLSHPCRPCCWGLCVALSCLGAGRASFALSHGSAF